MRAHACVYVLQDQDENDFAHIWSLIRTQCLYVLLCMCVCMCVCVVISSKTKMVVILFISGLS